MERNFEILFGLFADSLLRIPCRQPTRCPIERLSYALGSTGIDDEEWFESTAKEALRDTLCEFRTIMGVKALSSERDVIAIGAAKLKIEYLLLIPEWDREFMQAKGTSNDFHLVVYWDSLTWPKARVISAGLDVDDEGLRRVVNAGLRH